MSKEMTKEQKLQIRAEIFKIQLKSKAEVRAEINSSVEAFLRSGGVIQEGKPPRKRRGAVMSAKSTRSSAKGTGGIANGFPRKCTVAF